VSKGRKVGDELARRLGPALRWVEKRMNAADAGGNERPLHPPGPLHGKLQYALAPGGSQPMTIWEWDEDAGEWQESEDEQMVYAAPEQSDTIAADVFVFAYYGIQRGVWEVRPSSVTQPPAVEMKWSGTSWRLSDDSASSDVHFTGGGAGGDAHGSATIASSGTFGPVGTADWTSHFSVTASSTFAGPTITLTANGLYRLTLNLVPQAPYQSRTVSINTEDGGSPLHAHEVLIPALLNGATAGLGMSLSVRDGANTNRMSILYCGHLPPITTSRSMLYRASSTNDRNLRIILDAYYCDGDTAPIVDSGSLILEKLESAS
jgi:hypothetical protein